MHAVVRHVMKADNRFAYTMVVIQILTCGAGWWLWPGGLATDMTLGQIRVSWLLEFVASLYFWQMGLRGLFAALRSIK
jgi:hypothetical protein